MELKPQRRFRVALLDATAGGVHRPEGKLRVGITRFRPSAYLVERLR